MSASEQAPVSAGYSAPKDSSRASMAAFAFGLPLAVGILALFYVGPLKGSAARRYVSHPVECVEVIMFCCAVSAFGAKLWRYRSERAALGAEYLPEWNGTPIPLRETAGLIAGVDQMKRSLRMTCLGRRITAVLHFLHGRGSAVDLDDQLRALADNDALALEGSYSLTRFITWAIPILGFLGTVLGITGAISGVTPEVLEKSLSQVTDGLALAFDATALGLALTMVTMFLGFVVERAEQSILEVVDRYADQQLAHRFERQPPQETKVLAAVQQNSDLVFRGIQQLMQRQVEVWDRAQSEADRRHTEIGKRFQQDLLAGLRTALDQTLETHARRLAELERQAVSQGGGFLERIAAQAAAVCDSGRQQQETLAGLLTGISAHAENMVRLQDGGKELVRLQDLLNQNLTALAGAGSFEQAVHSLTAAIHLLTTRSGGTAIGDDPTRRTRPGKAA